MKNPAAKTALAALFAATFAAGSAMAADVTIGYQLTYNPWKVQMEKLKKDGLGGKSIEFVKFTVTGTDTDEPLIYFINTETYRAHPMFAGAIGHTLTWTIAAILHMEGAEAIDPGLDALYAFHAMGLRSIGPVWSRPTAFGHGVPFRYPGSPDTGPGLTDAGKALVRACDELGIMVDLSHLNEKGFDDVAAISTAPLVATHSNAWEVTNSTRNLTDRQLDLIAERDGMVGLNFAVGFLRPDGRRDPDIGWDPILRHLDHLISRLGETRVGFGSDFDGATIPDGIEDVSGLPALQQALRAHGYDDALMARLCHRNWQDLLGRVLR